MKKEDLKKQVEEKNARVKKASFESFKETLKKLDAVVKKRTGTEDKSIGLLTDLPMDVEYIPTGSFVLDSILGGGFAGGRILEIYGPEASGKTSVTLNAIANVQRRGGNAVFFDCEQALDPNYAKILGVDITKLGISQEIIAENVLAMIRTLIETDTVDIIVVDSVASMTTKAEIEDLDKAQVATLPRILSKQLRVISQLCNKHNTTLIMLNQIRDNVGQMYGPSTGTPGGRALKFFASQRIEVKRIGKVTEGGKDIGTEVKLKVIKNKVARPFLEGTTVLTFAKGINRPAELLFVGMEKGLIIKRGNTLLFDPNGTKFKDMGLCSEDDKEPNLIKLGIGKGKALEAIQSSQEVTDFLCVQMEKIFEQERLGVLTTMPVQEEEENDEENLEMD